MKHEITVITMTILFLSYSQTFAAVDFTREELELAKGACLAGSGYDFKTEADGSISIKNLEGSGKLAVSKKDVTTVDLPDSDKKEEFNNIRNCIKDYLHGSNLKNQSSSAKKYGAEIIHRIQFLETALKSGTSKDYVLEQFVQNIDHAPPMFGELKDESFSALLFSLRESENIENKKKIDDLIELHQKLTDKKSISMSCGNKPDVSIMRDCVQNNFLSPFVKILSEI